MKPERHEYPFTQSDVDWRRQLDPRAYAVTREGATERAFTGAFWNHWARGDYRCVGCGSSLFRSADKFDAGCGWPSFFEAAPGVQIERIEDLSHGMHRIEVRCARCGSHLGHVFDDGPAPTGERYCINSAALKFDPSP
ncbi:peptide-methionine (R)-S-oxide reductase MsrB [Inhella gelatinilytica]|uniref:Peptide methionine sulfoxide reductase MsrB n=1 Tax=Inhella gelatinilytica TaxID=2795030 RepID=A0A931ITN0_9BURK|nr:peptide-methionine (R)-S-oxide reductase MsrB [Inhella gelatinilytica]MBH9552520.1 peptide-methionine (R)-S-oxide reductase MsrB [Inhella gelatinilytica]